MDSILQNRQTIRKNDVDFIDRVEAGGEVFDEQLPLIGWAILKIEKYFEEKGVEVTAFISGRDLIMKGADKVEVS